MPGGRRAGQAQRAALNSAAGMIGIAAAVQAPPPEPTMDLNERERRFFDDVIASREGSTWARHDITLACLLAKTMRHAEAVETQLSISGYVAEGRSGQRAHPLIGAMLQCSQSVQALTRALGLSARQRGLATPAQESRNQADAAARDVIARARDEDLLA